MVERVEKATCITKKCHFPDFCCSEIVVKNDKTTVKVQNFGVEATQKIHFLRSDFTERARKIEAQGMSPLLIKLMVDEISQGFVVITTKRPDGKLHVIATKEIAQQIQNGSLTLQGKKDKIKEIAEVEVVLPEYFDEIARSLIASQQKAESKTEAVTQVILPKAQNVSFDDEYSREFFDSLHMGIFTTLKTLCNDVSRALERFIEEEKSHIQERVRKRQQLEREQEADDLRNRIKADEIRKSEQRVQLIKAK